MAEFSIGDLLGRGLSEAELKIWNEIQRTKAMAAERPGLDVNERLNDLGRQFYERTGANGGR